MSQLQLVSPGGERSQQFGENRLTDQTVQGQGERGLHTEEAVTDNVSGDTWTDEIVERPRNGKLHLRHFSLALTGERGGLFSQLYTCFFYFFTLKIS